MRKQDNKRDLSPLLLQFKDHTVPTYVTKKNLNAFSQRYKNDLNPA